MVKDYAGEAHGGFILSVFLYFTQGREDEMGDFTVSVPGQSTEVSTERYLSIRVQGINIRFFDMQFVKTFDLFYLMLDRLIFTAYLYSYSESV